MRKYRIRHDCKYWDSAKLALESARPLLGILDGALQTSGGNTWVHNYKCGDKKCVLFFRVTQCAPEGARKQVWVISQRKDGSGDSHSAHCNYAREASKGSRPPGNHLEYELPAGTLKHNTVLSRVRRNNVSGISESRTSPLSEIEPILVQYCVRLAKIGPPVTKDQLTRVALSMIKGTSIEEKIKAQKKNFSRFNESQNLLGDQWYQSFLNRNKLALSPDCESV